MDRSHQTGGSDNQGPEALVEQYLSLVDVIARKILRSLPSFVELDDLVGFGRLGLLEASRRFDPTRGVQFKTFGYYRIRGAIYDGIRKMTWFTKSASADVTFEAATNEVLSEAAERTRNDVGQPSLDDDIRETRESIQRIATARMLSLDAESAGEIADSGKTPLDVTELSEVIHLVRDSVAELDGKERSVIEDYYFGHKTLEEAGAKLGLSKSWTSRVHARALKKLGAICRERGLDSPT